MRLFLEPMPQHFSTADGSGEWERRNGGGCRALTKGHLGWRVRALRKVAREEGFERYVVPVWDIAATLHDYHPATDCTHWCVGRNMRHVYEALLDPLVRKLLAAPALSASLRPTALTL